MYTPRLKQAFGIAEENNQKLGNKEALRHARLSVHRYILQVVQIVKALRKGLWYHNVVNSYFTPCIFWGNKCVLSSKMKSIIW